MTGAVTSRGGGAAERRRGRRRIVCAVCLGFVWAAAGCGEETGERPRAEPEERPHARDRPADREPDDGAPSEATRLHVPPRLIHRARREVAGLARMPDRLRAQTLAGRRGEPAIDYATLRADPDAHEEASVSFEGHVGLVRPAGPRLWILALQTRREEDRWTDPLYVLSVVPPALPTDGGGTARVDGWVVGERTIGRHALPLVLAYHVEPTSPPAGAEDERADRARAVSRQ